MATHLLGLGLLATALVVAQTAVLTTNLKNDDDLYSLPDGLLIGAGLSATQSEGATSEGGKSESVLDRVAHSSNSPFKVTNDVAADHFHKYKEDLALAKKMKLTSHRFSISWSRVLPNGDTSVINHDGLNYYRDYIKEVKKNGMEPLVTMYHFDHPYILESKTGGWTNRTMIDYFVEYANILFKEFGTDVKYWNPINEGNMYCIFMPVQLQLAGLEEYDTKTFYKCVHNTVLAHAKTYRMYQKNYYKHQKGFVGTSVLLWPGQPATTDYADVMAANTLNDMFGGTSVHPHVFGDYPAITRQLVDERSKKLNLTEPRLPSFTDEEKHMLIGDGPSTDFVALNVYSGYRVTYDANNTNYKFLLGPMVEDMYFVKMVSGGGFETADGSVMKTALLWTWNNYRLPVVITENGFGDTHGHGVQDYDSRGNYYSVMLRSLVGTMKNYSVPVISFHAWSLLDSYEFSGGYDQRPFGLIHVEYSDNSLNRTLKESSRFFIEMAETKRVPLIASPSSATSVVSSFLLGLIAQLCISYRQVLH